jgi:DNA-binding NtrC family response regulator
MMSQGEKETVLIVDDDKSILVLFQRILSRANCKVVATSSPQVALNELKHSKIAVVVSDHDMPDIKGIELLEEAKRMTPDTIRIMVTAHDESPLAIDAINLAAVHKFLLKPVEPKLYLETVNQAIWLYENTQRSEKEEEKVKDVGLTVEQLSSGMILSRPVLTEAGKMLLPRNAELTASRLARVKQIHEVEPIEGKVYVHRLSEQITN